MGAPGPGREEAIVTRTQVNHLVAARTGESLDVIRRLGFQVKSEPGDEPVAEDICLVVHCPFCRGAVPYPGRARDGSAALAEYNRDRGIRRPAPPRRWARPVESTRPG